MDSEEILRSVRKLGIRAKGKKPLIEHLKGEELKRTAAIQAKCYECMGYYSEGKTRDCKCPSCPLYGFMPYKQK